MILVENGRSFQNSLRETGSYKTDPNHPVSFLGRRDLWYHLRVVAFIWEGYRTVKRGEYTDPIWAAHSLKYLRIVEDCGGKFDISGFEHRTKLNQPCVYIGNHMSLIEGFILPILLTTYDRIAAVAKESLLNYPLLGPITRAIDPIVVKRVNPREDLKAVLDQGKEFLEKGRSIVLFPQATRTHQFDRKSFNSLGVKLAKKAQAPIVPIALKTDFQMNGTWIKDMGGLDRSKTIHLKLGAPMRVEGTGKETNEAIMDFIESSIQEWSR